MSINTSSFAPNSRGFEPREYINHTSGYLTLSPTKSRYTVAGLPGFIAYREQGKHLFLMGGVQAPNAIRGQLLDSFLAEAAKRRRRVIALQVHEEQTDLFRACGFIVNQMGTSYGLRLPGFTLAGTPRMKLRHKIKRARAAGLRALEVGPEIPDGEATYTSIYRISEAWIKGKARKEIAFLIGEIGSPGQTERRIFVVVDADERMLGFITYVPVWGEYPGYLHDITRRLPGARQGTMELCNAYAIERFIEEGVAHLHFGFTPFIVDDVPRPGESRVLAWLLRMLGRYGGKLYPAQSQYMYKRKWAPDIVEREYAACRSFSLAALIDAFRLTRLL